MDQVAVVRIEQLDRRGDRGANDREFDVEGRLALEVHDFVGVQTIPVALRRPIVVVRQRRLGELDVRTHFVRVCQAGEVLVRAGTGPPIQTGPHPFARFAVIPEGDAILAGGAAAAEDLHALGQTRQVEIHRPVDRGPFVEEEALAAIELQAMVGRGAGVGLVGAAKRGALRVGLDDAVVDNADLRVFRGEQPRRGGVAGRCGVEVLLVADLPPPGAEHLVERRRRCVRRGGRRRKQRLERRVQLNPGLHAGIARHLHLQPGVVELVEARRPDWVEPRIVQELPRRLPRLGAEPVHQLIERQLDATGDELKRAVCCAGEPFGLQPLGEQCRLVPGIADAGVDDRVCASDTPLRRFELDRVANLGVDVRDLPAGQLRLRGDRHVGESADRRIAVADLDLEPVRRLAERSRLRGRVDG